MEFQAEFAMFIVFRYDFGYNYLKIKQNYFELCQSRRILLDNSFNIARFSSLLIYLLIAFVCVYMSCVYVYICMCVHGCDQTYYTRDSLNFNLLFKTSLEIVTGDKHC